MSSEYLFVNLDPVALRLGPLEIHWYGVMYLLAFGAFWWIARRRAETLPWYGWTREQVSDFLFYGMLGVVIGGRFGYVLFYGLDQWADDWLFPLKFKQGGMSFHGGLLGVLAAMAWFGRKTGHGFWGVADFVAPVVPLGLALGRLGNFIGGELWGRHSDVPWAMIFPNAIEPGGWASERLHEAWQAGLLDDQARHPSQLYQAGLEGLALFVILMWFSRRPRPRAAVSGLFLVGYGMFRFVVEFFREPDRHLGYLYADWLTMGMVLSLPMVAAGLALIAWAYARQPPTDGR
ncbi:MAG: prolipoprotein diacylglyceryl transferase [Xanthomonadales bacterium]|nr:prolipoprotein diacylglyceryl transferase [Xanthomonadales bacterium]